MLNVDQKIISKALAIKLKKVLPVLISPGQTAYVNGRFIGKIGGLISDIIEVCDIEKLSGYLMAIDFEKAFDSMNHAFLIAALKKYGFGDNFIDWIKTEDTQPNILSSKEELVKGIQYQHIFLFLLWKYFSF